MCESFWGEEMGVYRQQAWAQAVHLQLIGILFRCHCFPIRPCVMIAAIRLCVSTCGFTGVWFAQYLHTCLRERVRTPPENRKINTFGKKNSRTLLSHISFFSCCREAIFMWIFFGRVASSRRRRKFSYQIIVNWAHQTRCNAQSHPASGFDSMYKLHPNTCFWG